jgi:hypothetical protein
MNKDKAKDLTKDLWAKTKKQYNKTKIKVEIRIIAQ